MTQPFHSFYDGILEGYVSEQEIILRNEIVKNVRLLVETWPQDAETRIEVARRQLQTLDLFNPDSPPREGDG